MSQGETKTPLGEAVQKLPDVLAAIISDYVGFIDSASKLREDMDPGEYLLMPSMEEYEAFRRFIRNNNRDDVKFQLVLPQGLQQVGESAFAHCTSLTSVTFPEGLQQVGKFAFEGCESLAVATLPKGLKQVGTYAFLDCTSLTSVTFPEGLEEIGDDVFYDCTSLTSVTFPEGLQQVECWDVFDGCSSIQVIYVPENVSLDRDYLGIHPDVRIERIRRAPEQGAGSANKRQHTELRF